MKKYELQNRSKKKSQSCEIIMVKVKEIIMVPASVFLHVQNHKGIIYKEASRLLFGSHETSHMDRQARTGDTMLVKSK
jgi:hypothetical protein